jgi:hypothetical protein
MDLLKSSSLVKGDFMMPSVILNTLDNTEIRARLILSDNFPACFGGKRASLFEAVRCAYFPRMPGSFLMDASDELTTAISARLLWYHARATERRHTSR